MADAVTDEKTNLDEAPAARRRSTRGAHNALAGSDEEAKNFNSLLGQSELERKEAVQLGAQHTPYLPSRCLAECVGTFFLVLTVGVSTQSKITTLAPVAIGLMLAIQVYAFASVSGACLNPAVTVAVLLSGRDVMLPANAACYIGSQMLGGWIAGLLAYGVTDKSFCFTWEANASGGSGTSLLLEALYTGALCIVVLTAGTSHDTPNQYFGFAIGSTVMASAYACGGFDQGSFNPAVTWGMNFANVVNSKRPYSCDAGAWFMFLLVPFLGSALAAGVFRCTRRREYVKNAAHAFTESRIDEKLLAEFTGTFFLVLTVTVAVPGGGPMAAVAIGVMLGVMIFTFGSVSGANFNPAVTLAILLSGRGRITAADAAAYMGTQFVAGMIAGFVGYAITDKSFFFDHALTEPAGGPGSSFCLEAFCTAALCLTVLTTATSRDAPNEYFGFAIGLTVTASAILCGDFNQGSFNPAVTVGVNIANYANSKTENPTGGAWCLFLLTPFVGSLIATGIFMGTRLREYEDDSGKVQLFGNTDPQICGKPIATE